MIEVISTDVSYYSGFAECWVTDIDQILSNANLAFADQKDRTAMSQQLLLHSPDSKHTRAEAEEADLPTFNCRSSSHTYARNSFMACCCNVSRGERNNIFAELYLASLAWWDIKV